jgi:hypothetical protein
MLPLVTGKTRHEGHSALRCNVIRETDCLRKLPQAINSSGFLGSSSLQLIFRPILEPALNRLPVGIKDMSKS